jgi:hypothetical protein
LKLDTFWCGQYSVEMATKTTLKDLYSFLGFSAHATLKPHAKDPEGLIVTLERRQKKQFVPVAAQRYEVSGIAEFPWCGIWMPVQPASTVCHDLVITTSNKSSRFKSKTMIVIDISVWLERKQVTGIRNKLPALS